MKINVKHIAKLANLTITDSEEKVLETQLEATVEHVQSLTEIDTSTITGTNEVTNLSNVTREDVVELSLSQEQALQNAKRVYNGFFIVPAVLAEE